jgi:hypothetical protein
MKTKKTTKKKSKVLILDESKWICGDPLVNFGKRSRLTTRGEGSTRLLNDEGYMCCLGQFAKQLNPKITEGYLLNFADFNNFDVKIPFLTRRTKWKEITNSSISSIAISINDDIETTIQTKVKKLRSLFKTKGYKLIFKRKR